MIECLQNRDIIIKNLREKLCKQLFNKYYNQLDDWERKEFERVYKIKYGDKYLIK